MPAPRLAILLACLVLGCLPAVPAAGFSQGDPGRLCRAAIATAEREAGLPAQMLHAIARVESGRRDPATGLVLPWPWIINAEGRGSIFQSREEAIAAVQQLQARGVRSIDVGCMQINLSAHPGAFPSLEAAFDPLANARYAVQFLLRLNETRRDWNVTIGNYHSGTPERAGAYRAAVLAAWQQETRFAAIDPPGTLSGLGGLPAASAYRPPIMLGGFAGLGVGAGGFGMPALTAGGGSRAGLAMGGGTGGRGLDAYRAAPIPLMTRGPAPLRLADALPLR
ncbi:transglycosylase SLT domain-containing protein [Roseomonas sp. NAR14]|uniref:Transglycosylase SLT domain-containing protein n=1 Tax=Roseomonas acroporae TaxID=2937791 RepID=A0A9X1Y8B6_9PROT|nr:transglycosylase SLT domain-containing protein [Roseomonas acroporae]MCK8785769.1 transglycosylase SLT domain-containing protein [Roseomonas acroporae]